MLIKATITVIDTAPEFGDITGDEATITVTYPNPFYLNAPAVNRTLGVTKDEAARYRLGQSIPLMHF